MDYTLILIELGAILPQEKIESFSARSPAKIRPHLLPTEELEFRRLQFANYVPSHLSHSTKEEDPRRRFHMGFARQIPPEPNVEFLRALFAAGKQLAAVR